MAFFCINGAQECSACRACYGVSVCDICGEQLREGKKIYEDSDRVVCEKCAEALLSDLSDLSERVKDYI